MKEEPFVVIDTLGEEAGAFYKCKRCGKEHEIQFGTSDGKESKMAGFVDCGGKSYLVTINGCLI